MRLVLLQRPCRVSRWRQMLLIASLTSVSVTAASSTEKNQLNGLDSLPEKPEFVLEHSQNTTAAAGETAILNCRVRHIGSRQVSWGRGVEVLTGGLLVFADSQRFQPLHEPLQQDWALRIRRVSLADQGWYFCQVGTAPPVSHNIYLAVIVPRVRVLGAPEVFINRGSQTNLTCVIESSQLVRRPRLRWNHNEKLAEFDMTRRGVSVLTTHDRWRTVSSLLIRRTEPSDAGTYYCETDAVPADKIVVIVVNGDSPAAMQTGAQASSRHQLMFVTFGLLLTVVRPSLAGY